MANTNNSETHLPRKKKESVVVLDYRTRGVFRYGVDCDNPIGYQFCSGHEQECDHHPGIEWIHVRINSDEPDIQKIIQDIGYGLVLKMDGHNIIAIRKSRCDIFISSPSILRGETFKLEPNQPTTIFDYDNYFMPALQRFIQDPREVKPVINMVISFGQNFDLRVERSDDLPVTLNVLSSKANRVLTKVTSHRQVTNTDSRI